MAQNTSTCSYLGSVLSGHPLTNMSDVVCRELCWAHPPQFKHCQHCHVIWLHQKIERTCMYDHEKSEGVFLEEYKTEQDNLCLLFPLFLLWFPQEPGRYILATLPGLVNVGIYSTLYICKRCLHVLIEYESFKFAAIACSWPRHLCGRLIHFCENWLAFGMEVLFWCVLLSPSFSFVRNRPFAWWRHARCALWL